MQIFEGDPKTAMGALGWIALGGIAALIALGIGTLVPSIIPARATQSKL